MWILIIGLIVLTAIAMAVGYARNKKIQKKIESGELQAAPEIVEADAECCGQHEICEKESVPECFSAVMQSGCLQRCVGRC